MTFQPGGPLARRQAQQARRRPGRARLWLFGVIAVVVALAVAGNGGRSWWARRLGDLTNGDRTADFIIGLAIGMLPLIAVAIAGLARGRHRLLRMFAAGGAGFLVTDLLAPSMATAVRHSGERRKCLWTASVTRSASACASSRGRRFSWKATCSPHLPQ